MTDILEKFFTTRLKFGTIIVKLHNLHILSSTGVFKYLPFSIFKLLLLILILTNADIDVLFTSAHK